MHAASNTVEANLSCWVTLFEQLYTSHRKGMLIQNEVQRDQQNRVVLGGSILKTT